MAVIRQQTQVFNKPVGVVRADAGAAQVGQSIASAAGQLADIAYREGAIRAEEVGVEAALATPENKILTFNPETGKPEAIEVPRNYGTIAASAYTRVIDQRFNAAVDEDIQLRGKELAIKFDNAGNGAELYNEVMKDYIDQLSENAGGKYGEYIRTTGNKYREDTYLNMKARQTARAFAATVAAAKAKIDENLSQIEALAAQTGDSNDTNSFYTEAAAEIERNRIANVLTGPEAASALEKLNMRRTIGLSQNYFANNPYPAIAGNDLLNLQAGASAFNKLSPEIQAIMAPHLNDADAWRSVVGAFSTSAERSITATRIAMEQNADAFIKNYGDTPTGLTKTYWNEVALGNTATAQSNVEYLVRAYTSAVNDSLEIARTTGSEYLANKAMEGVSTAISNFEQATFASLVSGFDSRTDIEAVLTALQTKSDSDIEALRPDLQPLVQNVLNLSEGTGLDSIRTRIVDNIQSIASEKNFLLAKSEADAALAFATSIDESAFAFSSAKTNEDVDAIWASLVERGTSVDEGTRQSQLNIASTYASRAKIRLAFNSVFTQENVASVRDYLMRNIDDGTLSSSTKELLDDAKRFGAADPAQMNAAYSSIEGAWQESQAVQVARLRTEAIQSSIVNGYADPNDKATREAVFELYGADLNETTLPVFTMALPEPLYDAFSRFGDGSQNPEQLLTLATMWKQLRIVESNGYGVTSKSTLSIPADKQAILDEVVATIAIYAPQAEGFQDLAMIANASVAANAFFASSEGKAFLTGELGEGKTVLSRLREEFAGSAYSDEAITYAEARLSVNLYRKANGMAFTSTDDMINSIKADLSKRYVADPNVISESVPYIEDPAGTDWGGFGGFIKNTLSYAFGDFGDTSSMARFVDPMAKTMYPLSMTVGQNADLFMDYVRDQSGASNVKLLPAGMAQDGGTAYQVMIPTNIGYVPATKQIVPDESTEPVDVPVFISTREEGFIEILSGQQAMAEAEEISLAAEIQANEARTEANARAVALWYETNSQIISDISSSTGLIQAGTLSNLSKGSLASLNSLERTLNNRLKTFPNDRNIASLLVQIRTIKESFNAD